MHLTEQVTPPTSEAYRKCLVCGKVLTSKPCRKRRYCSSACGTRGHRVPDPEPTEEEIRNGTRRMSLTQGQCAIVDADMYEYLRKWTWHAVWTEKTRSFRVARNGDIGESTIAKNRRGTVTMARVVMNAPDDMVVDHRNHDTLNNTRANLRLATKEQNARNCRKMAITSSKFKGISYRKPWQAFVYSDGRQICLGDFETEAEAAEAYRLGAIKYYGEFACVESLAEYGSRDSESIKGDTIGVAQNA